MSFSQRHYDYIIGGAGLSGLSLCWHIATHPGLQDKTIALIESPDDEQNAQSKTWCFWSKDGLPEPVPIRHSWHKLEIFAGHTALTAPLEKMGYYCVQGGDYFARMSKKLSEFEAVDVIRGSIKGYGETARGVKIDVGGKSFSASCFFKSFGKPDLSRARFKLLQHFKGIEIETKKAVFDPLTARMMDFRVPQQDGATFVYVLPFSENKALIEYTLFSPSVLAEAAYDTAIADYITRYFGIEPGSYHITRSETGVIPMADSIHQATQGARVQLIGTASGIPKASTGYAFSRIHRQARQIADALSAAEVPRRKADSSARFRIYDLMLLDILSRDLGQIVPVFEALFANNPIERVLRFIDEQTTFTEDLQVMASVPWYPFLRAGFRNADMLLKGGVNPRTISSRG
ncbi:lycopene beta-cyclase [Cyclonatronum proteinivorum]|uniref:Lycopene beta-cyclase n=1 Tax=Cyclonatronum proteinivorum TaxID=1457365 RepID=A0A345UNL4_9BACT|nr:lycopene cyclase family protein [Cyclonatronum proteinivorum]AXJ02066.1 lycopene beta-cyclase [Cyclonatronum proteinivorum]